MVPPQLTLFVVFTLPVVAVLALLQFATRYGRARRKGARNPFREAVRPLTEDRYWWLFVAVAIIMVAVWYISVRTTSS